MLLTERWQRIADVFEAALERAPDQRRAWLAAACADDDEVRREAQSLLEGLLGAGGMGEVYRAHDTKLRA